MGSVCHMPQPRFSASFCLQAQECLRSAHRPFRYSFVIACLLLVCSCGTRIAQCHPMSYRWHMATYNVTLFTRTV